MPFDAARALSHLQQRKIKTCPTCSSPNLSIAPCLYLLRCYDPDTNTEVEMAPDVPTMPLTVVACRDCAHIMLFSATAIEHAR